MRKVLFSGWFSRYITTCYMKIIFNFVPNVCIFWKFIPYSYVWNFNNRRGLSKHYKGKSQSFTSLSEALTVEDLAKPENPFNAKLKQRRENLHCRRFSGPGGASERNLGGQDDFLAGNDRPPRLSGNRPPRAQTLSAAHISSLVTRS